MIAADSPGHLGRAMAQRDEIVTVDFLWRLRLPSIRQSKSPERYECRLFVWEGTSFAK